MFGPRRYEVGACYNTILLPSLGRDSLLGAITGYLAEHGAEVERVERQYRRGAPFATNPTKPVLFGPPSGSGWVPVTPWGDGLAPSPVGSTATPLARPPPRPR